MMISPFFFLLLLLLFCFFGNKDQWKSSKTGKQIKHTVHQNTARQRVRLTKLTVATILSFVVTIGGETTETCHSQEKRLKSRQIFLFGL